MQHPSVFLTFATAALLAAGDLSAQSPASRVTVSPGIALGVITGPRDGPVAAARPALLGHGAVVMATADLAGPRASPRPPP